MMVKAIKHGAHTSAAHPVTVLVVLHSLHHTLVFQCFFPVLQFSIMFLVTKKF